MWIRVGSGNRCQLICSNHHTLEVALAHNRAVVLANWLVILDPHPPTGRRSWHLANVAHFATLAAGVHLATVSDLQSEETQQEAEE